MYFSKSKRIQETKTNVKINTTTNGPKREANSSDAETKSGDESNVDHAIDELSEAETEALPSTSGYKWKERTSPRKKTKEKKSSGSSSSERRETSPEISMISFERKRKLYTAPDGNKIITPKPEGAEEESEGSEKRTKAKRRRIVSSETSDEGEKSVERERRREEGDDGEMSVSVPVSSDEELPVLIGVKGDPPRSSEERKEREERGKTGRNSEEGEVGKHAEEELLGGNEKDHLNNNSMASEKSQTSPARRDSSDDVEHHVTSPENDKENISRTPLELIPENAQRHNPKKRNVMKFKNQKQSKHENSSSSQNESLEIDIVAIAAGSTDSSTVSSSDEKVEKLKRRERTPVSPNEPDSPSKRVTRRSLELERTLPRSKLRVKPLQRKK